MDVNNPTTHHIPRYMTCIHTSKHGSEKYGNNGGICIADLHAAVVKIMVAFGVSYVLGASFLLEIQKTRA